MDLNLERGAALRRTHRDAGMKEQNDRAADVLSRRRAGSRSDSEGLELRICTLAVAVAAVGIAAAVAIEPSPILRTFLRRRQLVHVVIAEIAGVDEKGGELNEWRGERPDWLKHLLCAISNPGKESSRSLPFDVGCAGETRLRKC